MLFFHKMSNAEVTIHLYEMHHQLFGCEVIDNIMWLVFGIDNDNKLYSVLN